MLDDLQRVEKATAVAVEALQRQQGSAAEAAASNSSARFGAVQADMAELGAAVTQLRADAGKLEGGLRGER